MPRRCPERSGRRSARDDAGVPVHDDVDADSERGGYEPRAAYLAAMREWAAWFDTVNQFHGSSPTEGLAFSIRVDGIFTDELKARIPKPPINAASTPSYWASFDEQGEG